MRTVSNIDSESISALRFPLAALVVFVHCLNIQDLHISILGDWYTGDLGLFVCDSVKICISRVLGHIVVPCFMFISGYLFYVGMDDMNIKVWVKKMKSRIHSLLIPFVLWTIIILAVNVLWLHKVQLIDELFSQLTIWSMFCHRVSFVDFYGIGLIDMYPYVTPLWFMVDLMVFCLLSLWIQRFFIRSKWALILLMVLAMMTAHKDIAALFYFSIGGYMGLHNIEIVPFARRHKNIIFFVFAFFATAKFFLYDDDRNDVFWNMIYNISNFIYINAGIFVLFILSLIQKRARWISKEVKYSSFIIYVFHMEILWRTRWIINMFLDDNSTPIKALMVYFLSSIITIVILVLLSNLLRRYLPRVNYILTASR